MPLRRLPLLIPLLFALPVWAQATRPAADLVADAAAALARGDVATARKGFEAAVKLDPKHARALHGLGVCMLHARQSLAARERLDAAAANAVLATRPLILNRALAHGLSNNALRAAQLLADYLPVAPAPDVEATDLLGSLLAAVPKAQQSSPQFAKLRQTLAEQDARLEAARPGHVRWGDQWLTPAQRDEITAANAAVEAERAQVRADLDRLRTQGQTAQAEVRRLERPDVITSATRQQLADARQRLQALKDALDNAQRRLDALKSADRSPNYRPIERPPVGLDATEPPPTSTDPTTSRTAPSPGDRPAADPDPRSTPRSPSDPAAGDSPLPGAATDPRPVSPNSPPRTPVAVRPLSLLAFPVAEDLLIVPAVLTADHRLSADAPDGTHPPVTLVRSDPDTGLSLLHVRGGKYRPLRLADAAAGAKASVVAFPEETVFAPEAQLLDGTLTAPDTLSATKHPRLAGAAVLVDNALAALLAPDPAPDRRALRLVPASTLRAFLGKDFPTPTTPPPQDPTTQAVLLTITPP